MNLTETKPPTMPKHTETAAHEHEMKFRAGLDQFNTGRFFDAHETWEEIWLASREPEKTFLQGIIQIAAAFHHYGRGNLPGTRSLIQAGLRRLERFPATHRGIELEPLRGSARDWAVQLAAGHDPGHASLPRIHMTAKQG
jgi:predicted metal-dependent hydrolase